MNINDAVSVKLTERGLEIYEQHIKEMQELCPNITYMKSFMDKKVEEGAITMQLWEIMQIFGSSFVLGSEPSFTDIDIFIT